MGRGHRLRVEHDDDDGLKSFVVVVVVDLDAIVKSVCRTSTVAAAGRFFATPPNPHTLDAIQISKHPFDKRTAYLNSVTTHPKA